MTFEEFHAGVWALMTIDLPDIDQSLFKKPTECMGVMSRERFVRFQRDPHKQFVVMPERDARAIFEIMKERLPK